MPSFIFYLFTYFDVLLICLCDSPIRVAKTQDILCAPINSTDSRFCFHFLFWFLFLFVFYFSCGSYVWLLYSVVWKFRVHLLIRSSFFIILRIFACSFDSIKRYFQYTLCRRIASTAIRLSHRELRNLVQISHLLNFFVHTLFALHEPSNSIRCICIHSGELWSRRWSILYLCFSMTGQHKVRAQTIEHVSKVFHFAIDDVTLSLKSGHSREGKTHFTP